MTPTRKRWLLLILLLAWCAGLVGAYWYFLEQPKQWFDVQMQQPPVLSDLQEQQALRHLLQRRFPQLQSGKAWFVRMQQRDCGCERYVDLYHRSFAAQVDQAVMQVVALELSGGISAAEHDLLRRLIPATPSVVLFDPRGAVIYFGPYHQEGICNSENSYLEPVLQSLHTGQTLSILNTLVFGCFCSVP